MRVKSFTAPRGPRAPICVQRWGGATSGLGWVLEGVAPSRNRGSGVLPMENFENFVCQTVGIFLGIFAR